jgi:23S rRNA (adenine2503-C2)-methyltransferase
MSSPLDILGLTREALCAEMGLLHDKPGKGTYHGNAVFEALYKRGTFDPASLPEFAANPGLARKASARFALRLPEITDIRGDGDTFKFLMKLEGGLETESVVIPMKGYKTLCVSSQVGCKMGCRFCETAQMGFLKNLTPGEIVAQVFTARKILNEPIENIVFMGMGEPTDNLDAVITAIRVLSDPRGLCIPLPSITISTVGHVPGILRLAELAEKPVAEGGLRNLRLAVSLNASDDAVRGDLMPVNGSWRMDELKAALKRWPLPRPQDFIFVEYVLIAGVNDSMEDANRLVEYLRDVRATVNLIPYNPRRESPYARPAPESVSAFFRALMDAGQACRIRGTKGDSAMAACGQLGNRSLSRRRRTAESVSAGHPREGGE